MGDAHDGKARSIRCDGFSPDHAVRTERVAEILGLTGPRA